MRPKIALPPNSDVYTDGFRTNAKDLREQLGKIVEKGINDKEYLLSCAGRTNFSQPRPMNPGLNSSSQSSCSLLSVDDSRSVGFPGTPGWRTAITQQRVYTNRIKNEWEISPENKAIIDLVLGGRTFDYRQQKLCLDCKAIDILSPHTRMSLDMKTLKMKSTQPNCDLRELFYSAANDPGLTSRSRISLKRLENNLVLEDNDLKCCRLIDTQASWECGHGIRCEALLKLKNDKAAFLGDPNFPDYTIRPESTVGEQIDLSITLFKHYIHLDFSHPEDRPIAIDDLIEILAMAFKTRSLAGLFKTY